MLIISVRFDRRTGGDVGGNNSGSGDDSDSGGHGVRGGDSFRDGDRPDGLPGHLGRTFTTHCFVRSLIISVDSDNRRLRVFD